MASRMAMLLCVLCFTSRSTSAAQQQQHGHAMNNTKQQSKPMAPALIVFGDSIVDPGNNNAINTIIKADFPPYGDDFLNHHPTGRFCNGRIPTDFIASRLGLKELLPAYLSSQPLDKQDLLTGVSFASGGTGFDPLTPRLASVISMPDQLSMFHEYLAKVRAAAGNAKAAEILSRGVFAICAGSDDVANTYFTMRARSNYDHASYARLLVTHAAAFVEDLVRAGARRVAVIGIPPIGCVPSQRTMSGGLDRGCSEGHNEIAVAYNAGLDAAGQVPRHVARLHGHLRLPLRHDDAPAELRLHAIHPGMLRHRPPRGLGALQRRHLRRLLRRRRLPLLGQLPPHREGLQGPRRLRLRQLHQAHHLASSSSVVDSFTTALLKS